MSHASPTPSVLESADLGAWLDGFMPFALQRADIAGAVVVVVKEGQTLFEKGYGRADVKTGRPVDPQTTVLRPGSVSKLFTWTAVMQLAEQGKLGLDRDVNAYLDFQIPPAFGRPITLRQLLTHTAGFEDRFKNVLVKDRASLLPLDDYVRRALPPRLFPPGTVVAYSNYGATLAGYIVQRVSGQSYSTYIARHIFAPLEMNHSTFEQPVPAAVGLAPQGYVLASEPPAPFEFIGTIPAGALSTTAADMAHFMIAHLQNGRFLNAQILQAPTAVLMHAPAFRSAPALQSMSLGFYGEDRNGHRVIGHAGDLISFHADLHLLLDDHVGVFVGLNSLGKEVASSAVRLALFNGFMDRYFPAPASAPKVLPTASEHGRQLVGEYEPSRRGQSTFISLGNLLGVGTLTQRDDGTIALSTLLGFNGQPKHWQEVAPYVWREVNGTARLEAVMDGTRVRYLSSDDLPPVAVWQPVPTGSRSSWNVPLLAGTLGVFAITLIAWPIATRVRRHYRQPPAGRVHMLVRGVVVLNLVFLAGWLIFLLVASTHLALLADANDWILRLLQIAGAAGIVGLVPVIVNSARAWSDPSRGIGAKIGNTCLALACLATLWFAIGFHLLSFNLEY
ncbi:MAG: beta-lactamase family protein [Proteobacteria bacterium]|nr:beta-lactamase family protein [Pseudomonadota bacterium]